jgi:predicted membrane chloride channel (bestrophin family)
MFDKNVNPDVVIPRFARSENPVGHRLQQRLSQSVHLALRRQGSVLYRSLPIGIASVILTYLSGWLRVNESVNVRWWAATIEHPLGFQMFGILFAFIITHRVQRSLDRWWTGLKDVFEMQSIWHESFMVIMCYAKDRLLVLQTELRECGVEDAKCIELNEEIEKVKLLVHTMIHWFTLASSLALGTLKHGEQGALSQTQCVNDSFDWIYEAGTYDRSGRRNSRTFSDYTMTTGFGGIARNGPPTFGFLGGLTTAEHKQLIRVEERAIVVLQWIYEGIITIDREGLLKMPPPVQARVHAKLSEGLQHYHDAYTIASVPYPFPLAQLSMFFMGIFTILTPIVVEKFTQSQSGLLTPILAFILTVGYWGLNRVADELENPFGEDANDLPLLDFCEMYNQQVRETSVACLRDEFICSKSEGNASVHVYSDLHGYGLTCKTNLRMKDILQGSNLLL